MLEARRSSIILNSSSAWSTGSLQLENLSRRSSNAQQDDSNGLMQRGAGFLTPSKGLIAFIFLLVLVGVVVAVLMLTKKEEQQGLKLLFLH